MEAEKGLFREELEELQAKRNAALTFEERGTALRGIEEMLKAGEQQLLNAVWNDLHKSATETYITEIDQTLREVRLFRRKMRRWARPRHAGFSLMHFGARGRVIAEPYGVVLVMSPWNYPIQLALMPTVAAIGAGNRVVLSMSPRAKATLEVVRQLAARYVSSDVLRVVPAGVQDAPYIHTYRYDYVFYTGGPTFGRTVAQYAAGWLCPCTLELGGKSPVIVYGEKNLERAARRIAWGKWLNAGQTCVAPDYVLVERSEAQRFVELIVRCIGNSFGKDVAESADYARLVDEGAAKRLRSLLEELDVVSGGEVKEGQKYMSPTVVYNPPADHPIMQEEIFGPILPIVPIDTLQEAIDYINSRERPLALYFFGDGASFRQVLTQTRSGGVCRGDTIIHITHPGLPFGGIGGSGYGQYHGRAGFDLFTHRRSVLDASKSPEIAMRYSPYQPLQRVKRMLKAVK